MNTTTRLTAMLKKMVLPLVACGMMCATGAYAQLGDGDIIGFYSDQTTVANHTFTTAGRPDGVVRFTIRLYGCIVVSNFLPGATSQPTIQMAVGTGGATRYASLVDSKWTVPEEPTNSYNRTDLTFEYVVSPGDMADPLTIFGTRTGGFTPFNNQCLIYKVRPDGTTTNVSWKLNDLNLFAYPNANSFDNGLGIVRGDYDLSGQKISIRTLYFDNDLVTCPPTLIARQPAKTWRIKSGATNAMDVWVKVWTPNTNLLQIGDNPNQALDVKIPAGRDYADFAVKGLETNATPATIYAQRATDYVYGTTGLIGTNFISGSITIVSPGAPTISLEFPNGLSSQTLSETNNLNTGSFRIVLSETDTLPVYVRFDIANQPTNATNITIPGGYFVPANQFTSAWYPFSVKDGTVLSSSEPYVHITPVATNTAKYTASLDGVLNVANIPPSVQWAPPSSGYEYSPVTFNWSSLADVTADLAKGIVFTWDFGDGTAPVSVTNWPPTISGTITKTYKNIGLTARTYTVQLTVTDADGGSYTLPNHTITINKPIPQPNVSVTVNRADGIYQEGDTTATYQVVLSEPAQQDTWVQLKAQYWDTNSASASLALSTTNILIRKNFTSSISFGMTLLDGTAATASGIDIMPTINGVAKTQYPEAYPGVVIIQNVAPTIDTVPTSQPMTSTPVSAFNAIEVDKPFTFRYSATDVSADVTGAPPISVVFSFQDGTTTNAVGASGTATKTFTSIGEQQVNMIVKDKDDGTRTVPFRINVVNQSAPPSITVVNNNGIIRETSSSEGNQLSLIVSLSRTPESLGITKPVTVYLDVSPVNSPSNGVMSLISTNVVILPKDSSGPVYFTVQDGTALSIGNGFIVTPRMAANTPGSTLYTDIQPTRVLVQNVAPRIDIPFDQDTNTVATVDEPCIFNWTVLDVADDLPGMTLDWNWGDGTPNTTTRGGSGSTNHIFKAASSRISVSVTATDKDGGFERHTFYVVVKASKQIIALPIGKNPTPFNGYTKLGTGTIIATNASTSVWIPDENKYKFTFSAETQSAELNAIPDPFKGDKQCYFFAWDGPLAAFQNTKHVTQPLAPMSTVINFPTGTTGGTGTTALNGSLIQVSAIFTVEYVKEDVEKPSGVNNGDLNQDGVPDRLVQLYFIKPADAGGTGTTLNPIWFQNLGGFNDDEDYTPVYPYGHEGVIDFRPIANPATAAGGVPINAFTAFKEIRGYDNILGTDDDPGTDPTMLDTDQDGYPDGWEYWFWYQSEINGRNGSRYDPFNVAQGNRIDYSEITDAFHPMKHRIEYTDNLWRDDFDNDGLLDIEELVLGTDPTNWDTDRDLMADGWELINGFNPQDGRDGTLPAQNNPDNDYFAISTVLRAHIQVVISNNAVSGYSGPTVVTNHYLVGFTNGVQDNTTLTTAYHYGDDTAPWAVGRTVDDAVLAPTNGVILAGPATTNMYALIMHFQVRDEYLFDPRTAWVGTVGRFGGYGAGGGAPAGWPYSDADRFGAWLPAHAPNTRPFTAVDEYLLLKFMTELQLNGMLAAGDQGWITRMAVALSNATTEAGSSLRPDLIQESWLRFTTHPHTPDTDASTGGTDGVPDGWELYVAVNTTGPGPFNAFAHSPWFAEQAPLPYQREFWGTDSLQPYQDPNLYRFGMTDLNPMIGVVTIQRPLGHQDTFWVNKFWPTDPWSPDTDGDGMGDLGEGAFMYGNAVDTGGTCIAGGGLNPCSVDTDRDALPDPWEAQFAGGAVATGVAVPGQTNAIPMTINDGQDGTVADEFKDADMDGLVSYQEYMTQSIRAYRYDIPPLGATDPVTGQIGQPMDATFDIGTLFTEVTNVWDQCMIWPGPDPLFWMKPAGARYCSTDPSNPDTDYDGMDDFYEIYHGINPLLGNGRPTAPLEDRVAWAYGRPPYPAIGNPPLSYANNYWTLYVYPTAGVDFNLFPWLNGMPDSDPDADGLLNLEEMLAVNMPLVENYNTDPSPMWMTDPSNLSSITARFYNPISPTTGAMFYWPHVPPYPLFYYEFEMNEGYDTDNDGVSDKDELVTNRGEKSDPRDCEDPLRRQAIWFSGTNSAAVTPFIYSDYASIAGAPFIDMEQAFRSFTAELWARPEVVSNNTVQILMERAFDYGQSDAGNASPRLRRNFLIGIEADGRIFGGFDNPGGHDEHTDTVRLYGEKVVSNTWVHVAARMDGRTQKFSLFVNGVSQGEMSTTLIPATGIDPVRDYPTEGEVGQVVYRRGSLTIGAGSANIPVFMYGIGARMMWTTVWTDYDNFYRGWIDEVRVWDGARSNKEINDTFRKRFTRDDIIANRTQILEELNSGAARNALATNNFLSPILLNYYTFNNLFSAHEDQYVAQVPRGFNNPAVNTNRPNGDASGALVGWWNACAVPNTVYKNRHYLPWIENVVAHMPRVTMLVSTNGLATYVNDDVVSDSMYWKRRAAGTNATQNSFPNSNAPYGFTYGITPMIDLLPIGNAWAKQCVDFWDVQGASGYWLENSEPVKGGTTDDGLPTWWITNHVTTAGWNDLYTGTNEYYKVNGFANGEVYQRELAKGLLPPGVFNASYAQVADSSGGGMPDWWKRLYGLSLMDLTGEGGPLGDPDKDGLSNYAEYQVAEVYKFRYSSPLKFKTNPAQPVSDYFMKAVGCKLIMGAMFSDHDFIEDWWEELYAPVAVNAYQFDPETDSDSDGWSNWAEARYSQAVAAVRPDLRELVMVNAITTYEFPIPTVDTRLNYKGVQTSGNVVVQAFSTSDMNGAADATWNIAFGQAGVQANTLPLGFYADKTIRTRLSPGSVVPGTIHIQLTDTWTGVTDITGFDMNGVIYSMSTDNVWTPIGTINYITGEMVLEMGYFDNGSIILDAATYPASRDSYIDTRLSYYQMTYDTKLPAGWPQHIYLGRAATGALKEGKNYFFAFIDIDDNATWDAGEPAGIGTPFETDIGWDENALDIQLTDYTPNYLRLSLTTGQRSEDVIFGTATPAAGGGGQQPAVSGGYKRVRIMRAAVEYSKFAEEAIFDKIISGRDYIHEGDLMTMPTFGGYGLDWGFKDIYNDPSPPGSITYKVYVGDLEQTTNNTLVATFTNKFDAARAVPTTVLPKNGTYVYTARPTFTWSLTSTNGGYNAFALELRRGSSSTTSITNLVYPITVREMPLRDTQTGNYIWEAPFHMMGNKNVGNNGVYYWRVQMLNSKFSTTNSTASEWSSWKSFRWDVNTPLPPAGTATNLNGSSSGYGQLRAVTKYFGVATNLADRVVLQAFKNRGFTGFPAAQYMYAASKISSITNLSLSATNAIAMRGLTPGTYYVRAFIDSNANGVLDAWESWGYANYYGETKSLYDVRPVDVKYSSASPLVTVYMEDSDTDQDWFPDVYEFELKGDLSLGPVDGWVDRGDSEINPNLYTNAPAGGFFRMMSVMTSGSSEQQAVFFSLAVDPSASTTTTTPPAVKIQSLDFSSDGPTPNWNLIPGTTTTKTSSFQALYQRVSSVMSAPAPKTYTYNVRHSDSLAAPRKSWEIVETGSIRVDAAGKETKEPTMTNRAVVGTTGFFYVEVVENTVK